MTVAMAGSTHPFEGEHLGPEEFKLIRTLLITSSDCCCYAPARSASVAITAAKDMRINLWCGFSAVAQHGTA